MHASDLCILVLKMNCEVSLSSNSDETTGLSASHQGSQLDLPIMNLNALSKHPMVSNDVESSQSVQSIRRMTLPRNMKFNLPLVHFCNTPDQLKFHQADSSSKTGELDEPSAELGNFEASEPSIHDSSVFEDEEDRLIDNESTNMPLLSDSTSSRLTASQNSVALSAQYFLSNQAKLPKGVENIRPHLENIDNVPLLVPLFTDANPESTKEMLAIMQDYGEMVVAVGSSLNYGNAQIFAQANASIAVEPIQPSLCVNQQTSWEKNDIGPTDLANLLASLPCSLIICGGQHICLLQLITESRHWLALSRVFLGFLLSSYLMMVAVQLLTILSLVPPIFDTAQTCWLICFIIPALALSLLGTPKDPKILDWATSKNVNHVGRSAVKSFAATFCYRFLPSVFVCLILFHAMLYESGASCGVFWSSLNITDSCWSFWENSSNVYTARIVALFYIVLFLIGISASFVWYHYSLWALNPCRNRSWMVTCIAVLIAQTVYTIIQLCFNASNNSVEISSYLYIVGIIWLIPLIGINELAKRKDIKLFVRDQRRRRLSFNTKLGMNSPF